MSLYQEQRSLLKQYGLSPRSSRGWGQHFLIHQGVLRAIVRAAQIHNGSTVLEIGPGLGVLTNALLQAGARVIAIEQDRRWEQLLSDRFGHTPAFRLIIANALKISWTDAMQHGTYQIVANLPYAITTPVLEKMLREPHAPSSAVLLIQEDVARRLAAEAGTSARSALSVIAQLQWDIRRVAAVSRNDFFPVPKVDGAVIRCLPQSRKVPREFADFIHECFRHRRKKLASNLLAMRTKEAITAIMEKLGICNNARAQELTNEQWQRLYNAFER